jgi:hypothetical protein
VDSTTTYLSRFLYTHFNFDDVAIFCNSRSAVFAYGGMCFFSVDLSCCWNLEINLQMMAV